MKVCTHAQIRTFQRLAQTELLLSTDVINENMARDCATIARRLWPDNPPFVLLYGLHRRGALGLALARHLLSSGQRVQLAFVPDAMESGVNWDDTSNGSDRGDDTSDCAGIEEKAAWRNVSRISSYLRMHFSVVSHTVSDPEDLVRLLERDTVLVDALVDDSRNSPGDSVISVLETIGARVSRLLSIGVPSGVDGDTGQVQRAAVQATATVCWGVAPRGLFVAPGAFLCGQRFVSRTGLMPQLFEKQQSNVALNAPPALAPRTPWGHKGTFGNVLVISGAPSYCGAPVLASMAALRAGCGYVRLACPTSICNAVAPLAHEVVLLGQPTTAQGTIASTSAHELVSCANQCSFVVIGPGLSLHPDTQALVRTVVQACTQPLLIDGDGIRAIAGADGLLAQREAPTIVTPHPAEMASLVRTTTAEICADPITHAASAAQSLRANVVLKVAPAIVAHPNGSVSINTSGNDGMATAGSGDVLAGVIAAMFCLGQSPEDAATTGVFVHGLAGDLARDSLGADGMSARDILAHLPMAMRMYRDEHHRLMNCALRVVSCEL